MHFFLNLFVLTLIWVPISAEKYRPLLMIHGVNSDYTDMNQLIQWVSEDFPEMLTVSLDLFNDFYSVVSLEEQVPKFISLVKNYTDQYGSVNLLGYSQGGIVSRGVIEMGDNPLINNFISLSAPGLGQFGIPFLNTTEFLDPGLAEEVYHFCYTEFGQKVSICNYWHDPKQVERYLNASVYLPFINNEIKHVNSERYKSNFLNLSRVVLIGGPDDRVIQPWQSAQYSFWDSKLEVIPMKELNYYKEDLFGLRTLDEQGKLTFCTQSGIHHTSWPRTKSVYDKCIKPHIV